MWGNSSHISIRKRGDATTIFDTSRAKWNKFEAWNKGWVYLENPNDIGCWKGVRREWKHLVKESAKKKRKTDADSPLDPADQLRVGEICDFIES